MHSTANGCIGRPGNTLINRPLFLPFWTFNPLVVGLNTPSPVVGYLPKKIQNLPVKIVLS
jgi:hypothetical protein